MDGQVEAHTPAVSLEAVGRSALGDKRHTHSWDRTPVAFYGGTMDVVLKCMTCAARERFTLVPSDG